MLAAFARVFTAVAAHCPCRARAIAALKALATAAGAYRSRASGIIFGASAWAVILQAFAATRFCTSRRFSALRFIATIAVGAVFAVALSCACAAGTFVLAATIAAFTGIAAWKAIIFPMSVQHK